MMQVSEGVKSFGQTLAVIPLAVVSIAWSFGGIAGAIYWAYHRELVDAVLSVFIPFYGAISVLWDLLS
jgi:hypothetical protein